MSEMKISDVWGWGEIPQTYTQYDGFVHQGKAYNKPCYGLLFMTEEAAEAQARAVREHDSLVEEVERLRGERDELAKFAEEHKRWIPLAQYPFAIMEIDKLLTKIKGEDNE